jgi:hypothetical protein
MSKSIHYELNDSIKKLKKKTPWSRVLPEKLIVPQLAKKFLVCYGTRNFVTSFASWRRES